MPKLCLNMIVKNESHIIEETLRNIAQHAPIDYWVISDTGSTDDTVAIIERTMKELGIPGQLFHDDWVNFSHNRNLALEHAEGKADYIFIFDADDYLTGQVNWPTEWVADAYYMNLTSETRTIFYQRLLVVKSGKAFWRGVVHEFLEIKQPSIIADITGDYHVVSCRKGDRSRDEQKYLKDALLLKEALETNQDPDLRPRYLFYCAQSYMDADMTDESIYWYLERTKEQAGWSEEAYVSHLRLGYAYDSKGEEEKAIYHWLLGSQVNPRRAECWYQLSRINSWKGRYEAAYLFAKKAAALPQPGDGLFLGTDVYNYWAQYELFLTAYHVGDLATSYQAFKQLIIRKAPDYVYINELNKLPAFAQLIKEDSYHEVETFKQALQTNNLLPVLEQLGLFV